jgi:peptidoglycan/xylan/chitin deacetylase (PgdA/CDA1 family)
MRSPHQEDPVTDPSPFPEGNTTAVSLTFDVDAEAGWLGEGEDYARRLTILSEGRYGVVRGVPRILDLLGRHNIPATFFVPGYTAEHHPGLVDTLLEAAHEVAHHGYLHLRSDKVSSQAQTEEIERGLEVLARLGVPTPRGYRSTSWELTPETFELLVRTRPRCAAPGSPSSSPRAPSTATPASPCTPR